MKHEQRQHFLEVGHSCESCAQDFYLHYWVLLADDLESLLSRKHMFQLNNRSDTTRKIVVGSMMG